MRRCNSPTTVRACGSVPGVHVRAPGDRFDLKGARARVDAIVRVCWRGSMPGMARDGRQDRATNAPNRSHGSVASRRAARRVASRVPDAVRATRASGFRRQRRRRDRELEHRARRRLLRELRSTAERRDQRHRHQELARPGRARRRRDHARAPGRPQRPARQHPGRHPPRPRRLPARRPRQQPVGEQR